MFYNFPVIKTIDDVLPHIDDNFIVADKGEYTIINYILPDKQTFPDVNDLSSAIRRECRGITFCNKTGKLLRRPYHKWFNLGEREEVSEAVVSSNMFKNQYSILDKLDGSMVCPLVIPETNRLVFGTKMGETHLSPKIDQFVLENPQYVKFSRYCIAMGFSPIFEWYSSEDRIVVNYGKQPKMWLTAIRNIENGTYVSYEDLVEARNGWKVPVVENHQINVDQIKQNQKSNITDEGYVIRFDNGHMVKIKFEHYCKVHKAKSCLTKERHIVDLILNEKIDDLKPFLEPDELNDLQNFEVSLHNKINQMFHTFDTNFNVLKASKIDKKTLALKYKDITPHWLMSLLFKYFEKQYQTSDIIQDIKQTILKHCNKDVKYKENCVDNLLKDVVRWKPIMFSGEN